MSSLSMGTGWVQSLVEKSREEMKEITDEAEVLVGEFFEMDKVDVTERLVVGHATLPQALVMKLVCGFLWFKVHKYTDREKKHILQQHFGVVRATIDHHLRDVISIVSEQDVRRSDTIKCFRKCWPLMADIGIKMNVEGWLKSRAMQVRFIDRQIDMLQKRKDKILIQSNETTQV